MSSRRVMPRTDRDRTRDEGWGHGQNEHGEPTSPREQMRASRGEVITPTRWWSVDMRPGAHVVSGAIALGLAVGLGLSLTTVKDAEKILEAARHYQGLNVSVKIDDEWKPLNTLTPDEYNNKIKPKIIAVKDKARVADHPQSPYMEAKISGFGSECPLSIKASALLRILDKGPVRPTQSGEVPLALMAYVCGWNEKVTAEKRAQFLLPTHAPTAVEWKSAKPKTTRDAASAAPKVPELSAPVTAASAPKTPASAASAPEKPASSASAPTAQIFGPGVTAQMAGASHFTVGKA